MFTCCTLSVLLLTGLGAVVVTGKHHADKMELGKPDKLAIVGQKGLAMVDFASVSNY